jgi:AmmeMemoRadiSam system protein B
MHRRRFLFALALSCSGCSRKPPPQRSTPDAAMPTLSQANVFGPTVAGRFYTDDPGALRESVESFLSAGAKAPPIEASRRIVALVAPHAGYVYSGPIAGVAYAAARTRPVRTVVVLSPSHHGRRPHVCALVADAYRTPLGQVPIARSVVEALLAQGDLVREDESMFRPEHALDVQVPFIQVAFPTARIVPLIVPMMPRERLVLLGKRLHDAVGADPGTLVVASSDLSHFYDYDEARTIDDAIVSELERKDLTTVFDKHDVRRGPCGIAPIIATWSYVEQFGGPGIVHRLSVLSSGDTRPEGRDRVVGYAALALSVP